jgi:uncharacterized protein YjfI (DUF2170 family)
LAKANFIPLNNFKVNSSQERKLNMVFGLIAALSGLAAILIFIDNRKHTTLQEEIFVLDKELKLMQLEKLKNDKK